MSESEYIRGLAAIVCSHIAEHNYPILRAVRDQPLDELDSGWQFLCDSAKPETEETGKVWILKEVLVTEPTLEPWVNFPIGTILQRQEDSSAWKVIEGSSKP